MPRRKNVLFLACLLAAGEALLATPGLRPGVRVGARSPAFALRMAEDDEVTFSFGDAQISDEAATAVQAEEVEMTEQEKENARLRAAEVFMRKETGNAQCSTCGYKYIAEKGAPGLPPGGLLFADVPDGWACPNCKSPKAFFEAETVEIAGFEDNQAYGFGTNTWTEAQKSTAIFGGLAAFFALFIGGYALN